MFGPIQIRLPFFRGDSTPHCCDRRRAQTIYLPSPAPRPLPSAFGGWSTSRFNASPICSEHAEARRSTTSPWALKFQPQPRRHSPSELRRRSMPMWHSQHVLRHRPLGSNDSFGNGAFEPNAFSKAPSATRRPNRRENSASCGRSVA